MSGPCLVGEWVNCTHPEKMSAVRKTHPLGGVGPNSATPHAIRNRTNKGPVSSNGNTGADKNNQELACEKGLHSLDIPVQRASGQHTLGYCPSAEDAAHQSKGKSCTGEGREGGKEEGGGKEEKKGRKEKKKVVVVVVVVFALGG